MSKQIDERVVSMKFDNSNFEKNVSQSMGTLDKLKKSLDMTATTESIGKFENAANNINISGLNTAISAIENRFSILGIAGMTVISNLTTSAMDAISRITSSIKDLTITGGISRAMNIEKAKFQLDGLGIKYEEVAGDINYAVTDTAYSLDAAAQAASQLATAGLDYKEVLFIHQSDEQAITEMGMALKAVSGVAAQTQSDFSMVARYFQDVATAGKVTGSTLTYMTQVLNLPVAQNLAEGLNAIVDGSFEASESVVKAAKKITKGAKVTTENISELCKDGLIDFETFSTIMFNKYADHASAANKTFDGVTANIRSAFAKIGAEFVQPIIQNEGPLVQMLDSVRAKVNEFKKVIIPVAKVTTDFLNSIFEKLKVIIDAINISEMSADMGNLTWAIQVLKDTFKNLKAIIMPIGKAFDSVFNDDKNQIINSFLKGFDRLLKSLALTDAEANNVERTFKGFFTILNICKKVLFAVINGVGEFIKGFDYLGWSIGCVTASFGDFIVGVNAAMEEAGFFVKLSEKISKVLKTIAESISMIFYDALVSYSEEVHVITGIVTGLLAAIRSFVAGFISLYGAITGKNVTAQLDKFYADTRKILNSIAAFIDGVIEGNAGFKQFIETIKSCIKPMGSATNGFNKFSEALKEHMPDAGSFVLLIMKGLDAFFGFLSNFVPAIAILGKAIGNALKGVFVSIKNALNDGALGQVLRDTSLAILLYNLKNVFVQIRKLMARVPKIGSIGKMFVETIDQVKDSLFAWEKQLTAGFFMQIAAALLILAISLTVIAGIDNDKLASSMAAITGLMIELGLFTKSLSKLDFKKSIRNGAKSLLTLSFTLLILASALKKLSDLNWEQLSVGLTGVGALLTELSLTMWFISKNVKRFTKGALGLVFMAAAIRILADAVYKLAYIPWENLQNGLFAVSVLLAGMALFTTKVSKSAKLISIGIGIMAVAEAIVILAKAAKDFATMSWEDLGKAGAAIGSLLVALSLFSNFTSGLFNMVSLGVGLIAIGAAMKIFASSAKDFAEMSWEDLGKAGASIGSLLFALLLFSRYASGLNLVIESVGLIAMGAALASFALDAKLFASMSWEELGKAGLALIGLVAGLTAFSTFCGNPAFLLASASLVIFAAALAILTPQLILLGSMPGGKIAKAIFSVVGALIALGLTASILGILSPLIGLAALSLKALGVSLALVGAGLIAISIGLSLLSTSLTVGITAILGGLLILARSFGEIIVALCQAILDAIPAIKEVIVTSVLTSLEVLSELSLTLAETVLDFILDALKMLVEKAPQITELVFELFVKVIDTLTNKAPALVTSLIGFFSAIGKAIADAGVFNVDHLFKIIEGFAIVTATIAVVAAIGPLIPQAMLALIGVGAVIAEMALIIAAVGELNKIPGLQELVSSGGNLLEAVGLAIGQFVGGIVGGVAAGASAGLPEIGTNLSKFMENVTPFIEGAKLVDGSVITGVASLAGAILAITAANIIDGITTWLSGSNSIDKFTEDVTKLGEGVVAFAESTKNINGASVEAAANAGKLIAEMAAALPNSGGVLGWFMGENDMGAFGSQLKDFGIAISDFSNAVSGKVDEEAVRSASNAGKLIADMASTLPNTGGVVGWFMGENDMNTFGPQLLAFGQALADFSGVMHENPIDENAIASASNAGKLLSGMASELPNTGGIVSFFTGDNDIKKFGKHLVSFGESLTEFSKVVSGNIDVDTLTAVSGIASVMATMAATLPNTGGIVSWFTGDTDLEAFGKNLVKLGKKLVEFNDNVSNSDFTPSTVAIDALQKIMEMCFKANTFDPAGLDLFVSSFEDLSKISVSNFCKGFNDGYTKAKDTMNNFLMSCINTLKGYYHSFKEVGVYLVDGFILGMGDSEAMSKVRQAASSMAKEAYNSAMKALDAHSPSKLFMEVGGYIPAGMAIGIDKMTDLVGESATNMANTAVNSTASVISKLSDTINNGMDIDPTIRPVLDLSEIQNGAKTIGSMIGDQTVSLNKSGSLASSVAGGMASKGSVASNEQSSATVYNYTQNNYSPKALSRIDIYRQTRNQLSGMKGTAQA